MDNELNERRAQAVSSFLETNPKTFLVMVKRAYILLQFFLGKEKASLSLAKEILHEEIGDLIDGTRAWDMAQFNAEQILWMNIKSEVSARAKKEIRYVSADAASTEDEEDEINHGMDNYVNTPAEDVEGNLDAENIENYCANVVLKDDEDAQIVFNEMLTGKKQKQIAKDLGLSIEEAETIIRNIRRKISNNIPYHMIENIPIKLKDKIINQK